MSTIQQSQSNSPVSPPAYHLPRLSPNFAKSREVFRRSGQKLLHDFGAHHIIVVTLTFPEPVTSTKTAHSRLNSWFNAVRERYRGYLWILEPHSNGSIHYHILLATDVDVYAGTLLSAFDARSDAKPSLKRRCMGPGLRAEADWLEQTAATYGFGRIEVAPIYSEDPLAIIHYMMKCRWRFHPLPFDEKRYIRWWGCSRNFRGGTIKFSWNFEKNRAHRIKLRDWALQILGVAADNIARIRQLEETGFGELRRRLGARWGWRFLCWLQDGEPPVMPVPERQEFDVELSRLSGTWEWPFRRWVLDGKPQSVER